MTRTASLSQAPMEEEVNIKVLLSRSCRIDQGIIDLAEHIVNEMNLPYGFLKTRQNAISLDRSDLKYVN